MQIGLTFESPTQLSSPSAAASCHGACGRPNLVRSRVIISRTRSSMYCSLLRCSASCRRAYSTSDRSFQQTLPNSSRDFSSSGEGSKRRGVCSLVGLRTLNCPVARMSRASGPTVCLTEVEPCATNAFVTSLDFSSASHVAASDDFKPGLSV